MREAKFEETPKVFMDQENWQRVYPLALSRNPTGTQAGMVLKLSSTTAVYRVCFAETLYRKIPMHQHAAVQGKQGLCLSVTLEELVAHRRALPSNCYRSPSWATDVTCWGFILILDPCKPSTTGSTPTTLGAGRLNERRAISYTLTLLLH